MQKGHFLLVVLASVAILTAWLMPMGNSQPARLDPRRNSAFPPAYLVYTFVHQGFVDRNGQRNATRLFGLMPDDPERDMIVVTRDQLLDNYRVHPQQIVQVPTRLPNRWLAQHRQKRRAQASAAQP